MGEEAEVIIGILRPEDLDQVLAIEQESFNQPWNRGLFEQEMRRSVVSTSLAAYREVIEGDGVVRRRIILGYIVFWVVADEVHILNLAVSPEHRRKGIGRRLVCEAIRRGQSLGAMRAFLEVRASNVSAQRLYSSLGFIGIGLRRAYYSMPPEDALVMLLEGKAFDALLRSV